MEMINIIFIYLCFWVFISSCFIRWVVGLNKTTHFDIDKEAIENKCIAQKEQIEILVQEVQRLQLKTLQEDVILNNLKEDKALFLETIKLEKKLIDNEIKTISIRPELDNSKSSEISDELINTFIKHYENPIKDNDVLNNLYDNANNNILSENEIRSLFKKEIYKNTHRGIC